MPGFDQAADHGAQLAGGDGGGIIARAPLLRTSPCFVCGLMASRSAVDLTP